MRIAVDRPLAERIIFPAERGVDQIEDQQLAQWLASTPGLSAHGEGGEGDDDPSPPDRPA